MDREEILAKSKKENTYGDERERNLRTHRDAFSVWGTLLSCFIIMVIKLVKVQSPADIISILAFTSATASLYEVIHSKKTLHIILTVILYLAAVYFFYKFCMGIF